MKTCTECTLEFSPSSRHRKCPKCRSQATKRACVCGQPMAKYSLACHSCTDRTGSNNHNWKGGKTRHKAGYVMIHVPTHPRAKSNNGYVFEHILVMEESLGRYLVAGENVHHKNGIRDDNNLSNLELWCKPQPSGIRAQDAYLHALAIIELYEPLFGNSLVE